MNTKYDWPRIREAYITGDMSYRALALAEGINPSTLVNRANTDGWEADRTKYKQGVVARSLNAIIETQADQLIGARGEVIDALRRGVKHFVSGLARTKKEVQPAEIDEETGKITRYALVEVPAVTVLPKDLALLVDKVNILSGEPSEITRSQVEGNVTVTGNQLEQLSAEVLRVIADAAGDGLDDGGPASGSPLPRIADDRQA